MAEVVASFSGGKDSTAMVLRMIDKGEQLDEVIFCDTGLEFPAMYDHIDLIKDFVEGNGITFTTLRHDLGFHYLFAEKPVESEKWGLYHGYGWPGMHMRWCTKHLKLQLIADHLRGRDCIQCVGLAADEPRRIERANNTSHRHPLYEWGWTESICLGYCYGRGYDWYDPTVGKGLYELFERTSCYLCPFGTVDYFRTLRKYYPDLWQSIGKLESELRATRESDGKLLPNGWRYKASCSWADMEMRYAAEDAKGRAPTLEAFL